METAPTILVVDDNPTTRKLVRYALERQQHVVIEAADGKSALARCAEHSPDLVLQDLMLPDMDGFALLARLREIVAEGTPILAFSGFVSKLEEARISALGFDDHLMKPIEPSRLVQVVRAHLPRREADERFGTGRTVVVADDDAVQLKLAVFRLERLGFEVKSARDGAVALALARQKPPDVIVSDIMMPNLDGFRLCIEVRRDPSLRDVPVVLVTSSYVDEEDRALALQAGATATVLRTPDLGALIQELRAILSDSGRVRASLPDPKVEREHAQRVIRQLERQVQLNAGMAQQCAVLSAQLSILAGISRALTRQGDLDTALDEALMACFDAGEFSVGALCVLSPRRVRWFGMASPSPQADRALLYDVARLGPTELLGPVEVLPGENAGTEKLRSVLSPMGLGSALLVPLVHEDEPVGALLLGSTTRALLEEDHRAFVQGVGNQMSLALGLARTFEEKVQSERRAKETAATLEAVIDSLEEGVEVVDAQGVSSFWNRAAEPFASPDEELFHADWVTPVPREALPVVRAVRDEPYEPLEVFTRKGGVADRCFVASARPLVDPDGRKRGAVAVYRDVTAERRAQEQLMVADRMAAIGQLSAGVAHEINNPLAAVLANLELAVGDLAELETVREPLRQRDVAHRVRDELTDALEAGERVRDIVHDLKLFSRVAQDKQGVIDVRSVLESSLRMARNEIRRRARVVMALEPTAPVEGNASRLGQAFLNLLVNAAQAIPEGDAEKNEIRVSSRMVGDRVVVEITDTGQGITPRAMARLFTAFYSTKAPSVGAGLGLSICSQIVRGMKGEIGVESRPDEGTAFWVSLPALTIPHDEAPTPVLLDRLRRDTTRQTPPKAPPSASSELPTVVEGPKARILVIDDDPLILSALRRALGSRHTVSTAADPRDALALIAGGARYELVVCDLLMPRMTGLELFAELRALAPELMPRTLFVTGMADTDLALAALNATGVPPVEKPFDSSTIRKRVEERLEVLGRLGEGVP
jgi:CheY-like chemotaxis protein/signal transduction histidine kinase